MLHTPATEIRLKDPPTMVLYELVLLVSLPPGVVMVLEAPPTMVP